MTAQEQFYLMFQTLDVLKSLAFLWLFCWSLRAWWLKPENLLSQCKEFLSGTPTRTLDGEYIWPSAGGCKIHHYKKQYDFFAKSVHTKCALPQAVKLSLFYRKISSVAPP